MIVKLTRLLSITIVALTVGFVVVNKVGFAQGAHTKLLLHFDGTDGSKLFIDSSSQGHTVTAHGDAKISTFQSKLGGSGALFDGSGDFLSIPDNADWDFGTGDFTIDFWCRISDINLSSGLLSSSTGYNDWLNVIFNHLNKEIEFNVMGSINRWTWDPQADRWYHIALVRNGSTLKAFVDGRELTLSAGGRDSSLVSCSGELRLGLDSGGSRYMHGDIDELRISNGIARWNSHFTPPREPYYSIAGPGWLMSTADPISPAEADAYYNSKMGKSIRGIEAVAESSHAATPEITELARALQHDPKLIYDYVHNNIDYVPYFGLKKGATKTYLDGRGNDFDQASLMVELLHVSGYSAQFVYGTMTIPGAQMINWIGADGGAQVVGSVIPSGGIPNTNLLGDGTLDMDRIWVKATINSADYLFDPAFKSYAEPAKIDIGQTLGYNRNTLISAATSGASVGSDYVQNLNETGLANKLKEYSTNFVNQIKSQHPNKDMKDIIGRRTIVQTNIDQYQTSLPFTTTNTQVWSDIPASYIATINITHEGTGFNHTFDVPEIAGKRLTLTYNSTHLPELRLDGLVVATGSTTTPGNTYDLTITIDNPYANNGGTYTDQTSVYKVESGSTYAIVSQFGGMSDGVIKKRQKELDNYLNQGLSDTSEQVLGEGLNIMGLTWLYETDLAGSLLEELADTIDIPHHTVGLMAQEAGYYVDVRNNVSSIISRHNIASDKYAHFNSTASISSTFEHGVLEQLSGLVNPAASTIKLFQIANANGKKIFFADNGNWLSSIKNQLINYSSSQLNELQSYINQGRTLFLPEDGQLGLGEWQGTGYIRRFGNSSLGMIISGGYNGGYGGNTGYVSPPAVNHTTQVNVTPVSRKASIPTPKSKDPVDMTSGEYLYDRTDISLGGSPPLGLAFARSYNSGMNNSDRSLGYGWTHNYDIYLDRVSHGDPGLGERKPIDSAALITDLYVALDLMKNEDNVKGWTIMALAHKWAVDELIDNAVSVHLGSNVVEFIKLPDGTYSPPPGITTKLIDNGNGTFRLEERFGTQLDFDSNDRIADWTDIDGNTLSFTYSGSKLSSVQDSFGRTLSLSYNGDRISTVTDSTARSVSYSYNGSGDMVSVTDLDSKTWNYGYDSNHKMTSLQNPLGITTATNTYDTLDRVNTQTVPRDGGGTVTYNFYFSGFRNAEEDPDGNQIIYHLDDKGRTIGLENALGYKSTNDFDGENHIVKTTDPRDNVSTFLYDGNHNLTNVTNALNQVTVNAYDGQFRLTSVTDPLNHTTQFGYDAEHHLTSTTDAVSNSIGATYYANGQVDTTTDARSIATTITYDTNGNPQTTKTASHPTVTYSYDPVGLMNSLTDRVGATTAFNYKDSGLVTSRTDPLSRSTVSTYDDAGRLSNITDRNSNTITYAYTPTGKPKKITYPDLSETNFVFNQHDNLTSMTDSVGATTYTYDAIHRLTTTTDANGFAVTYAYDEANNLTQITYPGNKTVTYTYDALNRLKTVTNWLSQTATYTYDAAGRLTGLTNFNGTTTAYGYDNADRLTSLENRKSDSSVISTYNFTLDGNGNRTQTVKDEPLATVIPIENIAYTYNTQKNRLLTAGTTSFSHDNEGQLSGKGGTSYTFDYEHRLVGVGSTDTFTYNGIGDRLRAVRSGTETRYIYDAAGNLLAEADSSNTIIRYYVHGLGLLAMVTPSNQTYTYHYNAIGSTVAITDQSQNMVNKYAYTPFGRLANEQETFSQPFKFVGRYGIMAESNGLFYMRARYFDAETGRFISEDPIGFAGGDFNLYAYVGNNPVLLIDPLGLSEQGGDGDKASIFNRVLKTIDDLSIFPIRDSLIFIGNKYNKAIGWERVSVHTEKSTRKGSRKSGISIQEVYVNKYTGKKIVRHKLVNDKGKVVDDHFRPYYKPRDGDLSN